MRAVYRVSKIDDLATRASTASSVALFLPVYSGRRCFSRLRQGPTTNIDCLARTLIGNEASAGIDAQAVAM